MYLSKSQGLIIKTIILFLVVSQLNIITIIYQYNYLQLMQNDFKIRSKTLNFHAIQQHEIYFY